MATGRGTAAAGPEATETGASGGPLDQRRPKGRRCQWCGLTMVAGDGPGRPRRFCKQGCRQANYMAAKLAAAKGLDPDQVIVERAALDELLDRRFELNLALGDVERALADERAGDVELTIDARRQLDWLVEHVRRLTAVPFGSIGSAGQTG